MLLSAYSESMSASYLLAIFFMLKAYLMGIRLVMINCPWHGSLLLTRAGSRWYNWLHWPTQKGRKVPCSLIPVLPSLSCSSSRCISQYCWMLGSIFLFLGRTQPILADGSASQTSSKVTYQIWHTLSMVHSSTIMMKRESFFGPQFMSAISAEQLSILVFLHCPNAWHLLCSWQLPHCLWCLPTSQCGFFLCCCQLIFLEVQWFSLVTIASS